jgi:polyvinyl alcohol dehydrogenase (cytochrome)
MQRALTLITAIFLALSVGGVFGQAAPGDAPAPDYRNHHADLDSSINSGNVANMKKAWFMKTEEEVSHRPLIRDGRLYIADWGGNVYALDAKSGKPIWKKKVQDKVMEKWAWYGFAGTGALGHGEHANRLFEVSVEGNAFAIDTESGETIWQTKVANDEHGGNVGTIAYFDGMVLIGLQSVEEPLTQSIPDFKPNFRGSVLALDASRGEEIWRTSLVEAPGNGVPMWSSFAIDEEMGIAYFTTGNNYTGKATELSDAIVSIDARTGEIIWARQVTENDVWTMAQPHGPDWDFGAGPQLFEATIDGQQRQLVGAGQKSGTFYVWDRTNGEPVWATTVGDGAIGGGIHGEASIGADRIIIWGNNGFVYAEPADYPMDIAAVDPATGNYLWVTPEAQPALQISAGFLASDVYFIGSLDGMVRAYNVQNGKELWKSQPHGSIASSLTIDGNMLFWGSGVPGGFGGKPPYGVVAYRLGG